MPHFSFAQKGTLQNVRFVKGASLCLTLALQKKGSVERFFVLKMKFAKFRSALAFLQTVLYNEFGRALACVKTRNARRNV